MIKHSLCRIITHNSLQKWIEFVNGGNQLSFFVFVQELMFKPLSYIRIQIYVIMIITMIIITSMITTISN